MVQLVAGASTRLTAHGVAPLPTDENPNPAVAMLANVYEAGNMVVLEVLVNVKFWVTVRVTGTLPKLINAGALVDGGINPLPLVFCVAL